MVKADNYIYDKHKHIYSKGMFMTLLEYNIKCMNITREVILTEKRRQKCDKRDPPNISASVKVVQTDKDKRTTNQMLERLAWLFCFG